MINRRIFKRFFARDFLRAATSLAIVTIPLVLVATAGPAKDEGARNFWKISCFIYRDMNRNGIYDMGDPPYADLAVKMMRPDGSITSRVSNISGFANFEMILNQRGKADINEPGTYHVQAIAPPDWKFTAPASANQTLMFVARANAGSGMVPVLGCNHIGLAPELIISGAVSAGPETPRADIAVSAQTGNEPPIDIPFDDSGNFRFPAKEGKWTITVTDKRTQKSAARVVTVGNYNVIVSSISTETPRSEPDGGKLSVVDFDDLTVSDTLLEIPSGYAGLNWRYWISTHNKFYNGGGYANGTVSGEFIAYNSSGLPASIWRDAPFDFVGANISAAWPRGEADYVTVKAWRNGKQAYQDVFLISNAGASYFAADYLQVDRIEFSHGNYERIVLDDLLFRD